MESITLDGWPRAQKSIRATEEDRDSFSAKSPATNCPFFTDKASKTKIS